MFVFPMDDCCALFSVRCTCNSVTEMDKGDTTVANVKPKARINDTRLHDTTCDPKDKYEDELVTALTAVVADDGGDKDEVIHNLEGAFLNLGVKFSNLNCVLQDLLETKVSEDIADVIRHSYDD